MRQSAHGLFRSFKDQARVVRYSLRAEAEALGSALPKVLPGVGLGPLMAIGSPVLRLADDLFNHVETFAAGALKPQPGLDPSFPCSVFDCLRAEVSLSEQLYVPMKDILRKHGVRASLIFEQSLDDAGDQFRSRLADTMPRAGERSPELVVRACASLAYALTEARPIRRVRYDHLGSGEQRFMLSPNIYCGMVIGLAIALVTLTPSLAEDPEMFLDSVDSVVDARFGRFKLALSGKTPVIDLTREFESLVPFLP